MPGSVPEAEVTTCDPVDGRGTPVDRRPVVDAIGRSGGGGVSRVFVTGATGVLGRRVVPRLLAAGHVVTAVARCPKRMISTLFTRPRAEGGWEAN